MVAYDNLKTKELYTYNELGSLSNDDGDGNENGKKTISLYLQSNNSARTSRIFVHFSAVVARLRRERA